MEAVRVRMLLHGPDVGASSRPVLVPDNARKATGYRLDGTPVYDDPEPAKTGKKKPNAGDGLRWEVVEPRSRAVVAALPMPERFDDEENGFGWFALDQLEFETWEFGTRRDLEVDLEEGRRRTFHGAL